ncbi:helix-turn-helix domain-containing protein [Saccharothrix australiensis]|uniref:Helix-turn-helix protein n=1 Tax=Saccharothrix australiensis TaxID=2072 RepID=A0A495VT06_9PSEU|nr:helix-turn-helix transcriptional regulator [Saccharothrix australiensis]RKT51827.1 helix-turn-helix protein [Saccharothrix australiensis]
MGWIPPLIGSFALVEPLASTAVKTERLTTVRSRELGAELREARTRINLNADKLSKSLGWSASKVSRLEHGQRGADEFDLGALLGRLEVDAASRARIRRLIREQDLGYFLRAHAGRVADSLTCLIIHERAAITMCKYEPMLIPGLLQTESYARTVLELNGHSPDVVAEQVPARMARQSVLTGPNSPAAEFFIHETTLGARIGSNRIMQDQLMRLSFMSEWARIRPRVIPASVGGHPAMSHSFNLMTFTPPVGPVAYVESDVATVFVEDPDAIRAYQRKRQVLAGLALDAEQSRSAFARWADFYDRREDRDAPGPDVA